MSRRLRLQFSEAMREAEFEAAVGFDVDTQSPQDFAKYMKEDRELTAKIIKAAGIKLD